MLTVFVSDIHLDDKRPEITQRFFEFLEHLPDATERLFIVGDLFEAWIGDDAPGETGVAVIKRLRMLSDSGIAGFFTHGNRDFLISEQFAEQSGFQLLAAEALIDCYGEKVLLMHGDQLCIDDVEYQKLRAMVRNPQWQQQILSRSVEERLALATQMRAASAEQMHQKSEQIMDVNRAAVDEAFKSSEASILLHGHTHRPDIHKLNVDGKNCTRIVLGDWYEQGSAVLWSPKGYQLQSLPD